MRPEDARPAHERFEARILVDAITGCFNWTGPLDRDGYGARFRVGSHVDGTRTAVRPHRWAYEQAIGPIPDGFVPDHLCRNRRCVHPLHLEAVTRLVNHQRGLRAQRTMCPNGHAIVGANLVPRTGGGARCRICFNAYQRAYQRLARARS